MDPRHPFFQHTPANPSTQAPFGFSSTPGTPASQPTMPFDAFSHPQNPWQMQMQQQWQMQMYQQQWQMQMQQVPPIPQPQPQPQPQPKTQTQHESERPIGRDRAKKAGLKRKAPASASKEKAVEKIEELLKNFNDFKQVQTERYLERKKEKKEAAARDIERLQLDRKRLELDFLKQELEEFSIIKQSLEGLSETERLVAEKMKDKIARKWLGGAMP